MTLLGLLELQYDMVRKIVPAERLLEVKLGDGWEPLCEFLGRPVTRGPCPRANEREAAAREGKNIFAECLLIWTGLIFATGAGIYTIIKL